MTANSSDESTATKSISDLNIGGKKKRYTREEFDKRIEGRIRGQCDLEGVGTFYLVFGKVDENDEHKRSKVYLKFYNEEEEVEHTSYESLFKGPRKCNSPFFAISQNAFFFEDFLLSLDPLWKFYHFHRIDRQRKPLIADHISNRTSIHKTGLARIKETAETDFTLECDEGHQIEVHRSVMEGLWPFFQGMMNSDMKEVTEKKVKLPMPESTLKALVRYLYGEELNLDFNDAANLIVVAQTYELPELLDLATARVKSSSIDIELAIYLWRKSFEAQNVSLKKYASKRIEELMPDVEDFNSEIEHLEKAELVSLFADVAVSSKRRKLA